MSKFFLFLMGGLLAAVCATADMNNQADALARKTGGAPERLQNKQQQRYKGSTQNQPDDTRLARKTGGAKTRLLHRQHLRYRQLHQA